MKLDLKEQLDHVLISTVELPAILDGFNSFLGAAYCGPYETMVFPNGQWTELYLARYSTEAEAGIGDAPQVGVLAARFLKTAASRPDVGTTHVITDPDLAALLYRAAVRKLHPDAGGDPEQFRWATEAYDLLVAS